MSGTLRKKKENAALNVNMLALEISKEPSVLSFATPRPSNFYRAAKVGNEKGLQTMRRATNAQVATTWKKKRVHFPLLKVVVEGGANLKEEDVKEKNEKPKNVE